MTKFKSILSDEEHFDINVQVNIIYLRDKEVNDRLLHGRLVEQAVLAKLAEQEPVMHARTYGGEIDWDEACVTKKNDGELIDATGLREKEFARHGYAVIPLYAHPTPSSCQGLLDNSIPDKNDLPPLPPPFCKAPNGINYFDSYSKDQMIEYAKSAIDHHRAVKSCLDWSDPKPPTEGICHYDHVTADTPLGKFSIEWKSWKEYDTYCVYLSEDYLDSKDTLEEAKAFAQTHIENLALKLAGYISSVNGFCAPEGWQLVPKKIDHALLTPFNNCPEDELPLAWQAFLMIAPKYEGG